MPSISISLGASSSVGVGWAEVGVGVGWGDPFEGRFALTNFLSSLGRENRVKTVSSEVST